MQADVHHAPDAPIYIKEIKRGKVYGAVHDSTKNQLIDIPPFPVKDLERLTAKEFDWGKFIAEREAE